MRADGIVIRKTIYQRTLLFSLSIILLGCVGSTLKGYKEGSSEEHAIRAALLSYEQAWNSHDAPGLLELLHEEFVIFAGRDRRILYSKARYAFHLRDIMRRYRYLSFAKPTIWVKDNRAIVYAPMLVDGRPVSNRFHMIRKNGMWLFQDSEF